MKFDWILNMLKERIYPYTHIDAVIVDDSGTKLSDTISEINGHIDDADIHLPTGGEVGQVLTKTEMGNNWATVSGGDGEGGVTDYTLLSNLPKINNVTVVGNKGLGDYGVTATAIGVEEGANNYIHPSYPIKESGLYKISVDNFGHVNNVAPVTKDDITALGIPSEDTNTTYSITTHETDGLMSKDDKIRFDNYPKITFSTTVPEMLDDNEVRFVYEE